MDSSRRKKLEPVCAAMGQIMDDTLDKIIRIGFLYDFYGALLTKKQKECLNMYYLQDFSLAEIAEHFGTSRQAVHDTLRRAEQTVEKYEEKLFLLKKYQKEKILLREIGILINSLPQDAASLSEIKAANEKLKEFYLLLEDFREV
jgi:predicted DNA-binding protein YlxM (UPF0122 family)